MKSLSLIILTLAIIGLSSFTFATNANYFSYQTVLRESNRQVIANQEVSLRIRIIQGTPDGLPLYVETHEANSNQFGLVNIMVGSGIVEDGDFNDIDWGLDFFYLQVGIDPEGGQNYQNMEPSLIGTVPTAMEALTSLNAEYAEIAGHAATADNSTNANHSIYADSAGLANYANVAGQAANDMDTDPTNEIQDLSLSFSPFSAQLSIGNGASSTSLSYLLDSKWNTSSSNRIYNTGQVAIGTSSFSGFSKLTLGGSMDVLNGTIDLIGGSVSIRNSSNTQTRNLMGSNVANGGWFGVYGAASGNENITMSSLRKNDITYPNNGFIAVHGPEGVTTDNAAIRIFVDSNGDGIVAANEKDFWMKHPTDSTKEIWYACIEGPEAAAYDRGTAILEGGETFIQFSEHFALVGNHETMTVILTPLDANSKGLAVIEKSENGFKVKELYGGMGNYEFDWEVKCVRKGKENRKVIRSANSISYETIRKLK